MLGLCFFLVGCHAYEAVPRDIEVLEEKSSLGYMARMRYQRALYRLEGMRMPTAAASSGGVLEVRVSGLCRALKDEGVMRIKPRRTHMRHNTCKIIALFNEDESQATPLQLCYVDQKLWLDPDPNHRQHKYLASLFYPSPMWLIGAPMTPIQTYGVASLRRATLVVRQREGG